MQAAQFWEALHNLAYTAEVSQHYHQLQQGRMWWWDKGAKTAVAALAVLALLVVFLPAQWTWLGSVSVPLATATALVLNLIPAGEWEMEYGERFRRYSDLLRDAEELAFHAPARGEGEPVEPQLVERLIGLAGRQCRLDAQGPPSDEGLLWRCQGDVSERMYGQGVGPRARTNGGR
jgi:hypothetical protein